MVLENGTQYVFVAEAYKDGERIEQIVHTSKHNAREDIQISTGGDDPDRIEIEKRRVWRGDMTHEY